MSCGTRQFFRPALHHLKNKSLVFLAIRIERSHICDLEKLRRKELVSEEAQVVVFPGQIDEGELPTVAFFGERTGNGEARRGGAYRLCEVHCKRKHQRWLKSSVILPYRPW